MEAQAIRIGGASGFWGDAALATRQLLDHGNVDFIVYDYLAEITMSILARARAKDPNLGYAADFVTAAIAPNLERITACGVRIISNAGGLNPRACAHAIETAIRSNGLSLSVAYIDGDDLTAKAEELARSGITELYDETPFPDPTRIASINAYTGAFAIADALNRGADIVVTGRCVDSAVTLGACIHAFSWGKSDYDKLAAGSLAGHVIECGTQATGGNFTDWELCVDTMETIGYPIVEISNEGSFTVSKPDGTGGLVTPGTVAEQILYEIGDPQAYVLPDVTCDFSEVRLDRNGDDIVFVSGAAGSPPPDELKVCATWIDGFRGGHLFSFYGFNADRKAQRFAEAAIARARTHLKAANLPDFTETSIEVLGAESQFGAFANRREYREVCVKLAARHESDKAISLLFREATGLGLSSPPGLSGFAGTRPRPSPVVRLFSFLLPRETVALDVHFDGETNTISSERHFGTVPIVRPELPAAPDMSGDMAIVPLISLALGRSGDKGNKANIGIIARDPEFMPWLWAALTEEIIAERFGHFLKGRVERFYLPGLNAINFLLHDVLGGGGVVSLRNDPQGKGYAQLLLDCPIAIPSTMAEKLK